VLVPPVTCSQDSWYALSVVSIAVGLLFLLEAGPRASFLRTLRLVRHDELAAEVLV